MKTLSRMNCAQLRTLLSVISRLIVVLSILAVILLATGCGRESGDENTVSEDANTQVALTVVAGVHNNSMEIPLSSATIEEAIYQTCYTYGNISFINVDANPQVFYATKIEASDVKGLSETKLDSIASDYTAQLQQILAEAAPATAEVDTLKAITKAAQSLHGVSADTTDRKLLVLDTGLSTSGYLDFTKGLLNAEPSDVVTALNEAEAIPDLTNVDVIWAFCGEVGAPQASLTEKEKNNLKAIWEAVLTAGNAASVTFSDDFASAGVATGYPEVSTVDVDDTAIDVEVQESEPVAITIAEPLETVVLDESSVKFVADQATFVDESAATSALTAMAEELIAHPDNKVYIIGTTATVANRASDCRALSEMRAEAVVSKLEELGVPSSQLIPMGLGFEDAWHVEDIAEDGSLIEANAAQNRKVLMVDVNSEDAMRVG